MFLQKKITELLPYRESFDYKVELTEPIDNIGYCLLYSISPLKLAKVKEYLEENLVKGFIEPSSAAYALPVLFA